MKPTLTLSFACAIATGAPTKNALAKIILNCLAILNIVSPSILAIFFRSSVTIRLGLTGVPPKTPPEPARFQPRMMHCGRLPQESAIISSSVSSISVTYFRVYLSHCRRESIRTPPLYV